MLKKGGARIIIGIIIGVLLIGGVLYFVFSGGENSGTNLIGKSSPAGKMIQDPDGLCHNSEYSTEHWTSRGGTTFILLTDGSEDKLKEKINSEGNPALNGISNLACLTHLSLGFLTTYGENVDITDVSALSGLVNLEYLDLDSLRNLNDISGIAPLTKLEFLGVTGDHQGNKLRDLEDFSALSGLTNLKRLDLYDTKISDLSMLSKMNKLEYLELFYCNYLEDFSGIYGLDNLGEIELGYTGISDEDCDALKAALPNTDMNC